MSDQLEKQIKHFIDMSEKQVLHEIKMLEYKLQIFIMIGLFLSIFYILIMSTPVDHSNKEVVNVSKPQS